MRFSCCGRHSRSVLSSVHPSGDAALSKLNVGGGSSAYSPEDLEKLRVSLGLDQPVAIQYARALVHAVQGDFGRSIQTGGDAFSMFVEGVPETLQLAGLALVVGLALGIGVALIGAYVTWPPAKQFLLSLPAFGVSMPLFWVGLLLLQQVSFRWHLLPAIGNEGFASLILPSIVLAIPTSALAAQILSRSLDGAFNSPYIETARARGASRLRLLFGHALRNSIIPVVTALA